MSKIAITGATGFLGKALVESFVARGDEVRALARNPELPARSEFRGVRWFKCDLPDRIDPAALTGSVDVLIHCAFDTQFSNATQSYKTNVRGSQALFRKCAENGVQKIIFISSMSAHPEAQSLYGKTKLEVEGMLDPRRDLSIRPGFIIGNGGVFSRLRENIRNLPFIPLFYGGKQPIQAVGIEDLCTAIETAVRTDIKGMIFVSEVQSLSVRGFYQAIAEGEGKKARFALLPGALAFAALRTLEFLGFRLPLSSENLLGLKMLRTFDVEPDLKKLGLQPTGAVELIGRYCGK